MAFATPLLLKKLPIKRSSFTFLVDNFLVPGHKRLMGPLEKILTQKLTDKFQPQELILQNESLTHGLPASAEKHFKLIIVSEKFAPLTRVARHRAIHDLLSTELKEQVHALSIQAFTPQEWEKSKVHDSPECLGGGKHEKKW